MDAPIVQVEKAVKPLKPGYVSVETVKVNGRTYICRWYWDGKPGSADFTWQVRVCRQKKQQVSS